MEVEQPVTIEREEVDGEPLDFKLQKLQRSDYLTPEAQQAVKERAALWVQCELDEASRAAALYACKHGFPERNMPGYLFFLYFFGWIYEPRNPFGFKKLPFVPYGYQIRELKFMADAIFAGQGITGKKSVELWLKSRDMGLTWLVLAIFVWHFLFWDGVFHVGSRNESEVDYLGDVKTLFFKIRYLIANLPPWMVPEDIEDKKLLIAANNGETGISGESANPEFATGNRKNAVLADEFSKWEHDRSAYRSMHQVTNVIFLVGTPKGYGNYYAEIANKKTKIVVGIHRVHWTEHPLKTVDLEYVNGKATSSWYRGQCESMEEDMIGGELDLSFESSLKGIVFGGTYSSIHQRKGLKPLPGIPMVRCWDLGGTTAVIFLQVTKWRQVRVYKEIVVDNLGLLDIADEVLKVSKELEEKGCQVVDHYGRPLAARMNTSNWFSQYEDPGDPSGATMTKTNQEVPEYTELQEKKSINVEYLFMAVLAPALRVRARIVAIEDAMKRLITSPDDPGPGFLIDVDECPILDEALRGGYRRKLDKSGNVLDAIDERHPYEDVVDALGYGLVYKFGVPEKVKQEQNKKTEEEIEDEEAGDEDTQAQRGRSRC